MPFDMQGFTSASFQPRTAEVPVPDMAPFFTGLKEDETPTWKVRGLSGEELANARQAAEHAKQRQAMMDGLLGGKSEDVTAATAELAGYGSSVPPDYAHRIELIVLGSVEPEANHQVAAKLAQAYPVEFYQLTNKITELTGLGHEPGKPKRSTGTKKSG